MSNSMRLRIPQAGDMVAVPRQVWLATLGAAAVTREWAEKEAGTMFRALVKEGTVVESRAIRTVGERVEASVKRAASLARSARNGVRSSVASLAGVASTFVRARVPAMRARIEVESVAPSRKRAAKPVKRARKAVKARRRNVAAK